jgi:single-strand DNA-binding protein
MPSINNVTLLGHLGQDPELKYTQGGKAYCTASLATQRKWKEGDEWKQSPAAWHRIVAWQTLAETLANAHKGDLVLLLGELSQRSWENREGVKQHVTEVVARILAVIGKGHTETQSKKPDENGDPPSGPDDDVPF